MSARGIVGGALALVAAVALFVLVTSGGDPYVVRAEFENASGLRTKFKVTLGGVAVGTIEKVELSKRDTAIATMELDEGAGPLGRDAAATIKPTNLLGEKVVVLAPGDLRDPAPSGTTIPLKRTSTPVELDDVLNAFDADTRTALAVFFAEQGDALVGRTGDLAKTLDGLPPTLQEARQVVADLAADNRALGRLIESSDRVTATFARERRGLARFVDSAGGALDTLASRQAGLAGTVRSAPGAIRQLRASLVSLERAAGPLAPAARGLRAAAPGLTQTLRELPPFTEAARPALQTVKAVAPSLRQLARDGTPVVKRLRPAAAELSTFARAAEPVTKTVDDGIADLLGLIQGWARATQNRDGIGHVFRLGVTFSGTMRDALLSYVSPPAKRRAQRSREEPVDRPRAISDRALASKPPAVKLPDGKLPRVKLPPVKVGPIEVPGSGGGTPDQTVRDLLDFLMKP